ncbi:MAG TPA: DUF4837 family protein [Phaeodactylibacter sp.]|nr:DUF4837 family protein [Phaeodactylibacter sp.]
MNHRKSKRMNFSYLWKWSLFVFGLGIILASCSSESSSKHQAVMSGAIGKISEVVAVADDNVWEGIAGDTFRYYFGSPYLILPQPEPILDIRHLTPEQLENDHMLRDLRTYVFLGNLNDENSKTTKMIKKDIGEEKVRQALSDPNFHTVVGHNKWARGQMLTFVFGNSPDALAKNIKESYPSIAKRIHDFDQKNIGNSVYFRGRNIGIEKDIQKKVGLEIHIPQAYFVALDNENTTWLRKEDSKSSSNIFVHKLPYVSEKQFTQEGIRSIRDSLGKYVTTDIPGAYMRTNDKDLPMFVTPMEINGTYAVEARGIWDLVNDFMGGPFIGYLIHNKKKNELVYVEGFVHAPSVSKRKYMEKLEHILRTSKLTDSE